MNSIIHDVIYMIAQSEGKAEWEIIAAMEESLDIGMKNPIQKFKLNGIKFLIKAISPLLKKCFYT